MILKSLHLKVDAYAGSNITETYEEAVVLANCLQMGVWFDFNGVSILAKCGSDPKEIEQVWRNELQLRSKR